MRGPLLNFEWSPGVLLINFEGSSWVPLLNFRRVPDPTNKLWGGFMVLGPRVLGSWSHFYTMSDEPSLNDCLFSGPCLSLSVYDILLWFRLGKLGLLSDIKHAFLNIALAEKHRDWWRFLWYENFHADDPGVIILRFTRVVLGHDRSDWLIMRHLLCACVFPNNIRGMFWCRFSELIPADTPLKTAKVEF